MGRLHNYLRVHRRTWRLTQDELAFLLGYFDQSIIARLERGERAATLAVAHACELIFGVELRELFPALFESVEEGILARLHELRERVAEARELGASEKTLVKLELLQHAIGRVTALEEQGA
jgi:DNA-binding XRE family transcriptional regulator